MTQYSKINFIYRLQKWMDSVPGQTFLNYAYSWGAAIVILGTLFKLTYLPGANLMLYLGMGTEVIVFFLSAFDRPFDKTADGMDLPTHVDEEAEESEDSEYSEYSEHPKQSATVIGGGSGQTIIIGGGTGGGNVDGGHVAPAAANIPAAAVASSVETPVAPANIPPLTPDMTEATNAYVDELKKLTEVLERVSEQSKRLTTDSEEMENLNRTLTGICKVYEM